VCIIINVITKNKVENNECRRYLKYKRGKKYRWPSDFFAGKDKLKSQLLTDYEHCREKNAK